MFSLTNRLNSWYQCLRISGIEGLNFAIVE